MRIDGVVVNGRVKKTPLTATWPTYSETAAYTRSDGATTSFRVYGPAVVLVGLDPIVLFGNPTFPATFTVDDQPAVVQQLTPWYSARVTGEQWAAWIGVLPGWHTLTVTNTSAPTNPDPFTIVESFTVLR